MSKEVDKYEKQFEQRSDDELLSLLKEQRHDYTEEAISALVRVLARRGYTDSVLSVKSSYGPPMGTVDDHASFLSASTLLFVLFWIDGLILWLYYAGWLVEWVGSVLGFFLSIVVAPGVILFPCLYWLIEGEFPTMYFVLWGIGVVLIVSANLEKRYTGTPPNC